MEEGFKSEGNTEMDIKEDMEDMIVIDIKRRVTAKKKSNIGAKRRNMDSVQRRNVSRLGKEGNLVQQNKPKRGEELRGHTKVYTRSPTKAKKWQTVRQNIPPTQGNKWPQLPSTIHPFPVHF